MFCSNCVKEVDEKAFVCPDCGVKLRYDESGYQEKSKIAAGLPALVCWFFRNPQLLLRL